MQIRFTKPLSPISATPENSVMKILQQNNIPVASSCGGEGICLKCKIEVIDGREKLSPPTQLEQLAHAKGALSPRHRLSCQCRLVAGAGDVTIDTSYW